MPDPSGNPSGLFAGRYEIERVLGEGATAIVHRARDTRDGTTVAIKVLREELAESGANARFLKEIRRTTALTHPSIVPVLSSGEERGRPYFVLAYMEAGTLRHRLKRESQLDVHEALAIARSVAEALDHAHAQGLVHRDVKPENILFSQGRARLADFGIARALQTVYGDTTSANVVRGTPAYMSPEQAAGDSIDGRSDQFSLACVIYEMITGMQAYMGPTSENVIAQRFLHPPRSMSVYRASVTASFDAIVAKALSRQPADRYRSTAEFVAALEGSIAPAMVERRGGTSVWARLRRMPAKVLAGTAVAVVVVAGAAAAALVGDTPLNQNDWILVADFEGPADDPRLARDVRELTTQALKQSRFVQVFDRRQLNEVMRRASMPETTHVNVERARRLAARSSIRAVVTGGVARPTPGTLQLVLTIYDSENELPLLTKAVTATDATIADSVNALVQALRLDLGEAQAVITATRPLRDVATPSFEAFRFYSQALDAIALRNDHAASTRLLWQALRIDSGFAAAWAVMGANYLSARQLDSARFAYARAMAHPERLSAAEMYRLRGDASYAFEHDLHATLRWYDLFLTEAPNSRSGRTNRAVYRSALGQWEEAVRDLRDAVPLNPFGAALIQPTLFNLAAALVVVGRRDEARDVRDSLTGAPAAYIDLILAASESRWLDAERLAREALGDSRITGFYRTHAVTSLASALAAQGRRREADSVLAAAARSGAGATARWYDRARLLLALGDSGTGNSSRSLLSADTSAPADMLRSLWDAALGDTARARRLRVLRAPTSQASATVVGHAPLLIDAWLSLRAADAASAVALVREAAIAGEMDPTIFDRPDSYQLRLVLIRAYEALGRSDSARAVRALMLRPTLLPPGHFPLRGFVINREEGVP